MSPTATRTRSKRSTAKTAPAHTGQRERERCEKNDRAIKRIADSLDVAQADLGKLRGSVGSGVNDLRRDVSRLLRDARRDVKKMGTATRKDLERLQRDLAHPKSGGRSTA